jgi:hypothetical protein
MQGMPIQLKPVLLIFAWLFLSCSAGTSSSDATKNNEQQIVAEKFIANLISKDFKGAYGLFSPKIIEQYPVTFFEMVLNKNHERFGHPVSFTYQGEAEVDPNIDKTIQKASKSYMYLVVLKKEDKEQKVPLVLTFGSDGSTNQLITYKYLIDQIEQGEKKK